LTEDIKGQETEMGGVETILGK